MFFGALRSGERFSQSNTGLYSCSNWTPRFIVFAKNNGVLQPSPRQKPGSSPARNAGLKGLDSGLRRNDGIGPSESDETFGNPHIAILENNFRLAVVGRGRPMCLPRAGARPYVPSLLRPKL
jgi:hypothetical protein